MGREAFEHSVETLDLSVSLEAGRFLQVSSGFRILYDLSKEPGNRVASLRVLSDDGTSFEEVEDDSEHNVAVTNYIAGGGDGFDMLKTKRLARVIGSLDTEILQKTIEEESPI